MRKSFKALAVGAIAAATVSLASTPAFADTYSNYKGGVEQLYIPNGCVGYLDVWHNDTKGYWFGRGAFYSTGNVCNAALYRTDDMQFDWIKVSSTLVVNPGQGWVRTNYHPRYNTSQLKFCINNYPGDPVNGWCVNPW